MANIFTILTYPNPILRKRSEELDIKNINTKELSSFTEDMLETMYQSQGIGLSAPQVGSLRRLVVMDTRSAYCQGEAVELRELKRYQVDGATDLEKKISQPFTLINPKILERKAKTIFKEGCLSVPTYFENVERSQWICFEYYSLEGKKIVQEVDGLIAICVQHEIDHLDGKLFIDRLNLAEMERIKSHIEKHAYAKKYT